MKKLSKMLICGLVMVLLLTGCQANEQNVETTEHIEEESSSIGEETPIAVPTKLPTNTPIPTVAPTEVPEIEEEDVVVQEMTEEQEESDSVDLESMSISERLQYGDFSCLVESDVVENERVIEHYQRFFGNIPDRTRRCISYDLNGDGIEDLIWQEEFTDSDIGAVMGIFACTEDSACCVFWDEADYSHRFFFSSSENLILHSWSDDFYACTYYGYYEYDENWNRELVYGLKGYHITDFSEWSNEAWFQKHPEMGEVGSYFFRVTEAGGVEQDELLEQDEFLRLYEELTGFPFNDWKLE